MSLGMGVMVGLLSDNTESVSIFKEAGGKTINKIEIVNNELQFRFEDGTGIALRDDGQSCCENRYMATDDELSDFVGTQLINAEVRDGTEEEAEYSDVKESQFLVITTSVGQFTVVNYNEHNGYYGGFLLIAERLQKTS